MFFFKQRFLQKARRLFVQIKKLVYFPRSSFIIANACLYGKFLLSLCKTMLEKILLSYFSFKSAVNELLEFAKLSLRHIIFLKIPSTVLQTIFKISTIYLQQYVQQTLYKLNVWDKFVIQFIGEVGHNLAGIYRHASHYLCRVTGQN